MENQLVHRTAFECFVSRLNALLDSVASAAPGTPLVPGSARQDRRDESMVMQALDITNDPEFARRRDAVAALAASAPGLTDAYLEGMLVWRDAQGVAHTGSEPVTDAAEVLFGSTVLRLLAEPACFDALDPELSNTLEEIATSHLLRSIQRAGLGASDAGADSARSSQRRFALRDVCSVGTDGSSPLHELHLRASDDIWLDCQVVAEVSARVIGILSERKLYAVAARFVPRLDAAVRGGGQNGGAVELVRSLRFVRLGISGQEELDYSVQFFNQLLDILTEHRAEMDLKHELCFLITACMERVPLKLLGAEGMEWAGWEAVCNRMFRQTSEWSKKEKHMIPTLRAQSALLAAFTPESAFSQLHGPSLISRAASSSVDRGTAFASLLCIVRAASARPGHPDCAQRVENCRAAVLSIVDQLHSYRGKGAVDHTDAGGDQQSLLVELCATLGAQDYRPLARHDKSELDTSLDWLFERIVTPALGEQRTQESILFGLRIFVRVCRTFEMLTEEQNGGQKAAMEPRLLRHSRKLGPRLSALLQTSAPAVACSVLSCVPRAIPMTYEKLREEIYSKLLKATGSDEGVREAASAALLRLLRVWPPLRSSLVQSLCDHMCSFVHTRLAALPEAGDNDDGILSATSCLLSLIDEWSGIGMRVVTSEPEAMLHAIRADWTETETETETPAHIAAVVDSTALFLLASVPSLRMRSAAFRLLRASASLEEALTDGLMSADGQPHRRRLTTVDVLEQQSTSVLECAAGAAVGLPTEEVRWCNCLGALCRAATALCPELASRLWHLASSASETFKNPHRWQSVTVAALSTVQHTGPAQDMPLEVPFVDGTAVTYEQLIQTIVRKLESNLERDRLAAVGAAAWIEQSRECSDLWKPLAQLNADNLRLPPSDPTHMVLRSQLIGLHRQLSARATGDNADLVVHLISFLHFSLLFYADAAKQQMSLLWEVRSVRVDFCDFVRHLIEAAADPGHANVVTTDLRRRTFELLAGWAGHGARGKEAKRKEDQEQIALLKAQDTHGRAWQQEFEKHSQMVKQASYRAMCSLFSGPCLDDERGDGDIIEWAPTACRALPQPEPIEEAFVEHLRCNPAMLLPRLLQACFGTELPDRNMLHPIYIQAITSLCCEGLPTELLQTKLPALCLLSLFKMIDECGPVRQAAASLFRAVVELMQDEEPVVASDTVASLLTGSQVKDVYENHAISLSAWLASQNRSLTSPMIFECVLALSQPSLAPCGRSSIICLLNPWLLNVRFSNLSQGGVRQQSPGLSPRSGVGDVLAGPPEDVAQVLDGIFKLTQSFSRAHPREIEGLWATIASRSENVAPVVSFLVETIAISFGVDFESAILVVGQQIAVFLARQQPQYAVDAIMDAASALPVAPSAAVSPSDVAAMLLIDVVYESNANTVRRHVPLGLHLGLLGLANPNYAQRAAALLQSLLHAMGPEAGKAGGIDDLAAFHEVLVEAPESVWAVEDPDVAGAQPPPSELRWALDIVIRHFERSVPTLRDSWSHLALRWPLVDPRLDVMRRCHHIFRFVRERSKLELEHVETLLVSSHAFARQGKLEFLLETAATINAVIEHGEAWLDDLTLFPQLFWFAVGMCQADIDVVVEAGLRCVCSLLQKHPSLFDDTATRRSLTVGLSGARGWPQPFTGLHNLAADTLATQPKAISLLQALVRICTTARGDDDPLLVGSKAGHQESSPLDVVGCLLPWLCRHLSRAEGNQRVVKSVHAAKDTASNIAAMLKSRALAELATRFAELATNCASLQREAFLDKVAKPFFDAMGPGRCNAALQNLVGLLSGDYTFEALLVTQTLLASTISAPAGSPRDTTIVVSALLSPLRMLIARAQAIAAMSEPALSSAAMDVLELAAQAQQAACIPEQAGDVTTAGITSGVVAKSSGGDPVVRARCVKAWRKGPTGIQLQLGDGGQLGRRRFLTLCLGDELEVTSQGDEGWWTGEVKLRKAAGAGGFLVPLASTGDFPPDCVSVVEEPETDDPRTHRDSDAHTAALHAICLTLPDAELTSDSQGSTCPEHARWLQVGFDAGGGVRLAGGHDSDKATPWRPLSSGLFARDNSGSDEETACASKLLYGAWHGLADDTPAVNTPLTAPQHRRRRSTRLSLSLE